MAAKKRRALAKYVRREPRPKVTLRVKPEVLELLRQGGAFHEIGYQTYMNWLLEEGLKREAAYYGWTYPSPVFKVRGPTQVELDKADLLFNIGLKKTLKEKQREKKNDEDE